MHKNNLVPDTNLGKQIYLSMAGKGLTVQKNLSVPFDIALSGTEKLFCTVYLKYCSRSWQCLPGCWG